MEDCFSFLTINWYEKERERKREEEEEEVFF